MDQEVILKRGQLVEAWRAMYRKPLYIVIDMDLGAALERAWAEYDAAVVRAALDSAKRR